MSTRGVGEVVARSGWWQSDAIGEEGLRAAPVTMRDTIFEFPGDSLESQPDPAETPVRLVGAGRSGANFLAHAIDHSPSRRNLLERRYGRTIGARLRSVDRRHPDEATPDVVAKIRAHFRQVTPEGLTPVDKTPSNAPRLEFRLRVFPEARVVHILRDPRDNLVSRRIEAIGGKAVADLEPVGAGKLRRNAAAPRTRIAYGRTLIRHRSIPPGQIRATFTAQWRECASAATVVGRRLGPDRYLESPCEEMVANPAREADRPERFLGLREAGPIRMFLTGARSESVGRWRKTLSADKLPTMEPFLRPAFAYLGYEWES